MIAALYAVGRVKEALGEVGQEDRLERGRHFALVGICYMKHFFPGWRAEATQIEAVLRQDPVKIGVTAAAEPETRVTSMSTTGVPAPFDLESPFALQDPSWVEGALHQASSDMRHNPSRESSTTGPQTVLPRLEPLREAVKYANRMLDKATGQVSESGEASFRNGEEWFHRPNRARL